MPLSTPPAIRWHSSILAWLAAFQLQRLIVGACLPNAANRARASAADTSADKQPAHAASLSVGRAFSITRSVTSHPWRSSQMTCLKAATRSSWIASTIVSTLALNLVLVRLAEPASTAIGCPAGPSTANTLEWAMAAPLLFLSVRYQLIIRTSGRERNSATSAVSRASELSIPLRKPPTITVTGLFVAMRASHASPCMDVYPVTTWRCPAGWSTKNRLIRCIACRSKSGPIGPTTEHRSGTRHSQHNLGGSTPATKTVAQFRSDLPSNARAPTGPTAIQT